jgi:hypothetical protein
LRAEIEAVSPRLGRPNGFSQIPIDAKIEFVSRGRAEFAGVVAVFGRLTLPLRPPLRRA